MQNMPPIGGMFLRFQKPLPEKTREIFIFTI
jgi:hypothetical protein